MAVVGFLVFASAFAASIAVFWFTLMPALPRIVAILRDGADPVVAPQMQAVIREPRLRARAMPAPMLARTPLRAAA
jgi:hypothetical protein